MGHPGRDAPQSRCVRGRVGPAARLSRFARQCGEAVLQPDVTERSEAESFSSVPEQRARRRPIEAQSSHSSGYGEHLQRRAGVFWRDERA